MPVAMSAVGFAGEIGELELAEMFSRAGGRYGVLGASDLSCTVVPTADRTVRMSAGTAWGHGVLATLQADANVQFDLSASGTRWDMVVVRRTWSPPGGTAVLDVVKGVTSQQVSAFTQRKERFYPGGMVDEQPLHLVPITAGQQEPGQPVDVRCWFANGGMFAKSDVVRQYLDEPGTRVTIGDTDWVYTVGANDTAGWSLATSRRHGEFTNAAAGFPVASGVDFGVGALTLNSTASTASPATAPANSESVVISQEGIYAVSLRVSTGSPINARAYVDLVCGGTRYRTVFTGDTHGYVSVPNLRVGAGGMTVTPVIYQASGGNRTFSAHLAVTRVGP